MSMAEMLDELPRLNDDERRTILHRLAEPDPGLELDETAEMLAAIDEGVRAMEGGPGVPVVEARRRIAEWITK
jgi:predicted transcriptional regulator